MSISFDSQPLAELLRRIAAELRRLEQKTNAAQAGLTGLKLTHAQMEALQGIDDVQQSIVALHDCLIAVAVDIPDDWPINVRAYTESINLDALRQRLRGDGAKPDSPSGALDWF